MSVVTVRGLHWPKYARRSREEDSCTPDSLITRPNLGNARPSRTSLVYLYSDAVERHIESVDETTAESFEAKVVNLRILVTA